MVTLIEFLRDSERREAVMQYEMWLYGSDVYLLYHYLWLWRTFCKD